jgi:hypothetical protein
MKKKNLRRLSLHRETVRNLQPGAMAKAVGAGIQGCTLEDDTTCVCTLDCNSGGGSAGCGTGNCTWHLDCPTNTMLDYTCCDG